MKKSILNFKSVQALTRNELKNINGAYLDPCRIQEACCGKPGFPACKEK